MRTGTGSGSPGLPRTTGVPAYGTVHGRLRKWVGSASQFACAECGCPEASDWAFDNNESAPQTYRTPSGWLYSDDLSRYRPMCKKCHRKESSPEQCARGHDLTDDRNIYVAPSNKRFCRPCRVRRAREGYLRKKAAAAGY